MKKLRILLILCLTLAVTLPAASANSWNLSGQLLAMVEQTHDYDDYYAMVSDYNRKAATDPYDSDQPLSQSAGRGG